MARQVAKILLGTFLLAGCLHSLQKVPAKIPTATQDIEHEFLPDQIIFYDFSLQSFRKIFPKLSEDLFTNFTKSAILGMEGPFPMRTIAFPKVLPMMTWSDIQQVIMETMSILTQHMLEYGDDAERLYEYQSCFLPIIQALNLLGRDCDEASMVEIGQLPHEHT